MRETLTMMKSIMIGKEKEKSEKELIEEYKNSLCPNILAYFYVNNFGIIYKTSNLYPKLDDEDKASFCLQELDKCLQTFNTELNVKFITYFIQYFRRRLYAEQSLIECNCRKIMLDYDTLDDTVNNYYYDEHFTIDEFAKTYKLTKEEKLYCELYNKGYSTKDISNLVKKSIQLIYKKRKNIMKKIENMV